MELFNNDNGYEVFTEEGTAVIVKFQKFITDLIKDCRSKGVKEEEIVKMLKIFLNDYSIKKLYVNVKD